jgi:hypothetical protein
MPVLVNGVKYQDGSVFVNMFNPVSPVAAKPIDPDIPQTHHPCDRPTVCNPNEIVVNEDTGNNCNPHKMSTVCNLEEAPLSVNQDLPHIVHRDNTATVSNLHEKPVNQDMPHKFNSYKMPSVSNPKEIPVRTDVLHIRNTYKTPRIVPIITGTPNTNNSRTSNLKSPPVNDDEVEFLAEVKREPSSFPLLPTSATLTQPLLRRATQNLQGETISSVLYRSSSHTSSRVVEASSRDGTENPTEWKEVEIIDLTTETAGISDVAPNKKKENRY